MFLLNKIQQIDSTKQQYVCCSIENYVLLHIFKTELWFEYDTYLSFFYICTNCIQCLA